MNDTERLEKLASLMERVWSTPTRGGYRFPTRSGLLESGCFDCTPDDLRSYIDGAEI